MQAWRMITGMETGDCCNLESRRQLTLQRLVTPLIVLIVWMGAAQAQQDEESRRVPPAQTGDLSTHVPQPTQASNAGSFGIRLANDFKALFTTRQNLWILCAGLGAAAAAHPFDENVADSSLNSERHGGKHLDQFFEVGEILGGGLVQAGAAATTLALGKLTHNQGIAELGNDLLRAQVLTQGLTYSVKLALRRERPDTSNRRSFPSGHASTTFATATVLHRHYGWKIGGPAYAVAGYVACSRLNESKHYLSDVIFGATLGILVGRSVTVRIGQQRFNVDPLIGPEAVGIQIRLSR